MLMSRDNSRIRCLRDGNDDIQYGELEHPIGCPHSFRSDIQRGVQEPQTKRLQEEDHHGCDENMHDQRGIEGPLDQ